MKDPSSDTPVTVGLSLRVRLAATLLMLTMMAAGWARLWVGEPSDTYWRIPFVFSVVGVFFIVSLRTRAELFDGQVRLVGVLRSRTVPRDEITGLRSRLNTALVLRERKRAIWLVFLGGDHLDELGEALGLRIEGR